MRKKLLQRLCAVAFALMITLPAIANAALSVDTLHYMGVGLNESTHVKIGAYDVTLYAGFYNIDLTISGDPLWDGDYSGFAFCSEDQPIEEDYYTGYSLYKLDDTFKQAAWLMDQYLDDTDTAHEAASLQVAIWESILDSGSFNFAGGNFQILDSWDTALSSQYLAALSSADLTSWSAEAYRIVSDDGIDTSDGYQDFIIYNQVPIPSAVWLLASSLLCTACLRKKDRRE